MTEPNNPKPKVTPSRMEPDPNYNDDHELTEYIWRNYAQLISGKEHRIGKYDCITDDEAETLKSRNFSRYLQRTHGAFTAADAEAGKRELAAGLWAYRRKVRNRVLKEDGESVNINRCPKCQRILYSPKTLQCLPCSLSWHGTTPEQAMQSQSS